MKVFSVMDKKASLYLRPFFEKNSVSAIRSFEQACMEPKSPFYQYPGDFYLMEVGSFNEETGEISPVVPHLIAGAAEFVGSVKKPEPMQVVASQ